MALSRLARWLLWIIVIVFAGGALLTVAVMAFVFSIGTAVVTLDVVATALDKASGRPVAGCVLAFEKHQLSGWGQTAERTDAAGTSRHQVTYSYGGSPFMPWDRDRSPTLKFYFGGAPRYDTPDEIETWVVHLPFDEPWFDTTVTPRTRVERFVSFEDAKIDGNTRLAGARPLAPDAADVGPVVITLSKDSSGRAVYHIPLAISLDAGQIAACTRR